MLTNGGWSIAASNFAFGAGIPYKPNHVAGIAARFAFIKRNDALCGLVENGTPMSLNL
ncbi:MAG: hypothetical protein IPP88_13470 [Betaproteobacteria bacterium]|nr:hypothetical protein [Betaproteobacteria bacterium]